MSENPNNSQEEPKAEETSGGGEEIGKTEASATGQSGQRTRRANLNLLLRVDHTPPPVTLESGSVIIETDEPFVSRDNMGSGGHNRRHKLSAGRSIQGLKILDDAGDTIYLDGAAAGSSVKVWWNKSVATEQIFVDGASLNIEADADLGAGTNIAHPPGNNPFQRIKQYNHPNAGGRTIEKVVVVKNNTIVFSRELDASQPVNVNKVMIWDTTG